MSGFDISDAGVKGTSLDDLMDAARTSSPVSIEGLAAQSRLADRGVALLEKLRDHLFTLDSKTKRTQAVTKVMKDDASVFALASAWKTRNGDVEGLIAEILNHQGAAVPARKLLAVVKRRHSSMERDAARRIQQRTLDEGDESFKRLARSLGLPPGIECPAGYDISRNGIDLLTFDREGNEIRKPVALAPIVIAKRTCDVTDGTMQLEVAWHTRDSWRKEMVAKDKVKDSRSLVKLSRLDAPVDSTNSAEVVRFLSAFEQANIERLPEESVTWRLGWQSASCKEGFMLPERPHQPHGALRLSLSLRPNYDQYANGFRKKGSFQGWKEIIEKHVLHRPIPLLMLYASLASPLLHVLRNPGFILDVSGETSGGKSSALRVGASVWGLPDDMDDGIIKTWELTDTAMERMAGFFNSLPFFLDDTKHAVRDRAKIARAMYALPSGRGKSRGSIDGVREEQTWRLITLSTGEAAITSFSEDAGARARCICLRGAPFGEQTEANAWATREVRRGLMENYGHLGPILVGMLAESQNALGVKRLYLQHEAYYRGLATDAVSGRLGEHMAVLATAADLAHDQLGLSPARCDALGMAWNACLRGGKEADRPRSAVSDLFGFAVANEHDFWGRHKGNPSRGWNGTWRNDDDWEYIAFLKDVVIGQLKSWGYDHAGVIDSWRRRGWLMGDGKSTMIQVRMGPSGSRPRCIAIKREVLEGADEG